MKTVENVRRLDARPVRDAPGFAGGAAHRLSTLVGNLAMGRMVVQRACACGERCTKCQAEEVQRRSLLSSPERELHPHVGALVGLHSVMEQVSELPPTPSLRKHLAGLQTTYGNQAVLRMLNSSSRMQSTMPAPTATSAPQRKCACGGTLGPTGEYTACRQKREETLQRMGRGAAPVRSVPPIVHDALLSPGQPLDAATRAFMEPRFGRDFSGVRVHLDAKAAESARVINALAYTVGRNVVFGAGQYVPQTYKGRRLLAHELTHVVQQSGDFMDGVATKPMALLQPGDRYEREADRVAEAVTNGASPTLQAIVHQRAVAPFVGRRNVRETAAVLRTGTVLGSGVQFFPLQVTSTRIGPVVGAGGLLEDSRNRLSVIVGQSVTSRRIAGLILPLWNSAAPFTPSGAARPLITPSLSTDVLARGLLVYNRYYLRVLTQPAPSMTGWVGGLRLPLPIEIDVNGEGVVNKDLIQNLAAEFDPAWEPLLDQPASAVATPAAADLRQAVVDFLATHPDADDRGIALAARAITNPIDARPFVLEAFRQLGVGSFDVARAFMDSSVNSQIGLLASQRAGADILGAIRVALAAAPLTLSTRQQESLNRANHMLGLAATFAPRDMPFIQPTAVSAPGVHMIVGFEGFCPNLYDDAMRGCGLGRGNCTIGFGHLVHRDPCDGRASEAPFVGGINLQQAEQLLANELVGHANAVHNQVSVPLSQEQFDALVDFHFNTGNINALLPDLNANRFANIPGIMNQFVRGRVGARHIVMPGLVNRRAAEGRLFAFGQYPR